jgi:transglutaminase-like putative cysteine protease
VLVMSCKENAPTILSIDPPVALPGEVVTIRGDSFGSEQNDSFITLDSNPPISSAYLAWTDNHIQFRVPEIGRSGLVFVYKDGKKSNPSLFAYADTIPQRAVEESGFMEPQIHSLEPSISAVGSTMTILGSGFGTLREGGMVLFPSAADPSGQQWIEASTGGADYTLWSDREIQVMVPDGAASGNLELRTAWGNAAPVRFTLDRTLGDKVFSKRQSYIISYTVDIQVRSAKAPNVLYLWVPVPVAAASQPHVELLSLNTDPFVENYQGTKLFRFSDLASSDTKSITLSYLVTTYTVQTAIKTQAIPENAAVYMPVSPPTALIPSQDQRVSALARSLVGQERNPYVKAQKLYEWLIKTITLPVPARNRTVFEALDEQKTEAYSASLLFCALARSTGIQAIPITGVLVDKNRDVFVHHWAEFWIDGFGWISVDPALGAGAAPAYFDLPSDNAAYYFGSIDSRRIIFSRGELNHTVLDPRGRRTRQAHDYALQNYWEEAAGELEAYSSLWSDIQIIGVYNE